MFESVDRKNIAPVAIRTFQNSFSLLVITYALRYFPLTTVSMVGNLSPLLTVVLAYFILDESLTVEKAIQLVLAFIAVTMMVLGGD